MAASNMAISRRDLLASSAVLGLGLGASFAGARPRRLHGKHVRFVHFTDMHIQPELGAAQGVAKAIQAVMALDPLPDFVICGGDQVMDASIVPYARAEMEYRLFAEATKPLSMPVHPIVGNHDVFGWGRPDIGRTDPSYGKAMFAEMVLNGPTYRSFDFGGYHFVLLDSIQHEPTTGWRGCIDDAQLTWLANDLQSVQGRPTIVATHVPIFTLFTQYYEGTTHRPNDRIILHNGREVHHLLTKHNVLAVLQGHTHVVEDCNYLNTRYITGGAVSGDWWRGPRLGVHPEGFMVYDLDGHHVHANYRAFGWTAHA